MRLASIKVDNAFAAAIALALASVTPARAADARPTSSSNVGKPAIARQCLDDIQKFDEELWRVGFGVLEEGLVPPGTYNEPPLPGPTISGMQETARQKIRSLRNAAYVYALDDNEQSCQMVLASMRKIYTEHQKLIGPDADDPKVRMAWRRAHLARATLVAEMNHLIGADILIGSEVRNLKDDRLGEVEDLVLNPKKQEVLYVLISHGGFLGFGEKLVVVRWRDLRATEDHALYVLNVPPKAFNDAPTIKREDYARTADPKWQRSLDQYWDNVVK